jgi:hypothetical protein
VIKINAANYDFPSQIASLILSLEPATEPIRIKCGRATYKVDPAQWVEGDESP